MTVILGGDGLTPFDEVTLSTDAATMAVNIRDSTSQNIILVTGTFGVDTDGVYGRFSLLDSSDTALTDIKGRAGVFASTSSTANFTSSVSSNYFSLGNSNSDSNIDGERMSFHAQIHASQNSSQPFYDISFYACCVWVGTSNSPNIGNTYAYYRAAADPRKFKIHLSSGNISTGSLKSYIIGKD